MHDIFYGKNHVTRDTQLSSAGDAAVFYRQEKPVEEVESIHTQQVSPTSGSTRWKIKAFT